MIYKITNNTQNLDKRHPQYNKSVEIKFNAGFLTKKESLKPNETKYFVIDGTSLPTGIQTHKINGLIIVESVDPETVRQKQVPNKPVAAKQEKVVVKKKK